jgi:allantoate deiminase
MLKNNTIAAQKVMERCDLLASFSEEPGCITRRFASPPMHQVHSAITSWLRDIGIPVEIDAIGNLIGHYEGSHPHAKTLVIGSHLDTVRNAGKYDGLLGVMLALAALENLHTRGERLPFHIDLIGFADEEGLRYQSVYIGSKTVTGTFDPHDLALCDVDGISFADAVRTFGGNPDPILLTTPRWKREDLLGYCEVHIEQGPVLEAQSLPLAVVSSIVGQQRILFNFHGESGHAGTLPMSLRHDALCAAAEFVLAVETMGRSIPGLVATVGQMRIQPGAPNVVPGHIQLTLDIRHEDDSIRDQSAKHLSLQAQTICEQRGIALSWQLIQNSPTIPCSPALIQRWQQALTAENYPSFLLPSGAGHDAVTMSTLTDVSMLFLRCYRGISHNPAESVLLEDVSAAITALNRYLQLTAHVS